VKTGVLKTINYFRLVRIVVSAEASLIPTLRNSRSLERSSPRDRRPCDPTATPRPQEGNIVVEVTRGHAVLTSRLTNNNRLLMVCAVAVAGGGGQDKKV
jgi:hypothetical protein